LGGFIADIVGDLVWDGVVWGTGAFILKMISPTRKVDDTTAVVVGLFAWLFVIAALIAIGYWYFA